MTRGQVEGFAAGAAGARGSRRAGAVRLAPRPTPKSARGPSLHRVERRARKGKGLSSLDEVALSRRVLAAATTLTYDPAAMVVTLTPRSPLRTNTRYAIWHGAIGGEQPTKGDAAMPVVPFALDFRTEGERTATDDACRGGERSDESPWPDSDRGNGSPRGPQMVWSEPRDGDSSVRVDRPVRLAFDRPLDASTLNERTIGLRDVEAFRLFVEANVGLVHQAAGRYSRYGYPFDDLVQAGTLGLIRAVERFDPDRGYRFSTFSVWWVQQSIQRALAHLAPGVRVPDHVGELLDRASRAEENLSHQLGRLPSLSEVALDVGSTADRLSRLRYAKYAPVSLDRPVGEELDAPLLEFLPDPAARQPDVAASQAAVRKILEAALEELPGAQSRVIVLRFGLDDGVERTLAEVGAVLGLSRERVRQIEVKALQSLRTVGREDLGFSLS